MRILRTHQGFQADHSSSSYLFYAADRPVNQAGQRLAHRFSSWAEVDAKRARYLKWRESELSPNAYRELLGAHYDVMASESYDWWTLYIAVPKSAETEALLTPFRDARGYDDLGVTVEDFGQRLGPGRQGRRRYRANCRGPACPCVSLLLPQVPAKSRL